MTRPPTLAVEGRVQPHFALELAERPEDLHYMRRALELAALAETRGEVPVAALLVRDGQVLAESSNSPIADHDPTAHAEICALRLAAKRQQNYRLPGATLYVTLEPCLMCAGAIIHSRIQRVVFGAWDPKAGAVRSVYRVIAEPQLNHAVQYIGGILEAECSQRLKDFFRAKRQRHA